MAARVIHLHHLARAQALVAARIHAAVPNAVVSVTSSPANVASEPDDDAELVTIHQVTPQGQVKIGLILIDISFRGQQTFGTIRNVEVEPAFQRLRLFDVLIEVAHHIIHDNGFIEVQVSIKNTAANTKKFERHGYAIKGESFRKLTLANRTYDLHGHMG